MVKRYRHTQEEAVDSDPEVTIHPRHRVRRVKDPVRVARGKALWAAKSPEEQAEVKERLRRGRERILQVGTRRKIVRHAEGRHVRKGVHQVLLDRGFTKKEARELLADLQRDLGTTVRTKAKYISSTFPPLPPLQNPLPKFFAKYLPTIINKLTAPLRQQIDIIKNTVPIAKALGIIPPGSTAFSLLFRTLTQ